MIRVVTVIHRNTKGKYNTVTNENKLQMDYEIFKNPSGEEANKLAIVRFLKLNCFDLKGEIEAGRTGYFRGPFIKKLLLLFVYLLIFFFWRQT